MFASQYYLTLFTAALLKTACSDSDANTNNNVTDTAISENSAINTPAGPKKPQNTNIPIPHVKQDKKNSQANYHALLHKGYVNYGIPYELFKMVDPSLIKPIKNVKKLSDHNNKNTNMPYN